MQGKLAFKRSNPSRGCTLYTARVTDHLVYEITRVGNAGSWSLRFNGLSLGDYFSTLAAAKEAAQAHLNQIV